MLLTYFFSMFLNEFLQRNIFKGTHFALKNYGVACDFCSIRLVVMLQNIQIA